ncbi:sigma-70 family RNA polymerase sigma factor [Chitinophaga sp. SYP-B3965]|uniref:RNA polymerase sigma factor n=1 Tax=Chitinophaga sp. SYP-B3965 TaxID=2663120 RepID=UPI001299CDBB|nr:sigma-70 family RNA polymerase sigma factor [Chitinophaga sp. SYP-B3965]MRG45035.1 sigma-70 family RNA polymerase sigma factor [Chitinophaga sp. SYP-B3965]
MEKDELIPHLFRTEYRKIVSVLCKRFGFDQVAIAEDITSDTFLTATQSWGLKGLPENPTAWLYNVAKNKAKNYLQRSTFFEDKISAELQHSSAETTEETDIDLSPQNINDSQLQMMFTICHPTISSESQIGLSLRLLCGFGIEEIADAFLTSKETINKRLFRAKEKLREEGIKIAFPDPAAIEQRLETVLKTIYLLFNEGYTRLRKELCLEAMRLCIMLVENNSTNTPPVNALLSLMCFHTSRFDARIDEDGAMVLYGEQDTSRWNTDLISKGGYFLRNSASGKVTQYHLEAGIAYWHTQKEDTKEKWENILQNYNRLLQIAYSPMAALNRTYALSKVNGKPAAIKAAEQLELTDNHLCFALLGELYTGINNEKAQTHFAKAIALAKTPAEKEALQRKKNLSQ